MKDLTKLQRVLSVIGVAAFSVVGLLAFPALAQPVDLTTEVTPYFTQLKDQAMDLVPLALTVIGVGVAFGLIIRWFHRAG